MVMMRSMISSSFSLYRPSSLLIRYPSMSMWVSWDFLLSSTSSFRMLTMFFLACKHNYYTVSVSTFKTKNLKINPLHSKSQSNLKPTAIIGAGKINRQRQRAQNQLKELRHESLRNWGGGFDVSNLLERGEKGHLKKERKNQQVSGEEAGNWRN